MLLFFKDGNWHILLLPLGLYIEANQSHLIVGALELTVSHKRKSMNVDILEFMVFSQKRKSAAD
jgi:competence protein ComGF